MAFSGERVRLRSALAAVLVSTVLVASILVIALMPTQSFATFPGVNGRIAFDSERDGNFEIYVMNPDGTGQTRLTENPASEFSPSWSPDGSKIAFSSDRDGQFEIYVMNPDGTGQTRLTHNNSTNFSPSWSPDGSKIAFSSNMDGQFDVFVMNADGSDVKNLTNNPTAFSAGPSWSPDGRKITFSRQTGLGLEDVFVMNADGTGVKNLTNATTVTTSNGAASWSPDGSKIIFTNRIQNGPENLYVMDPDGSNSHLLVGGSSASWSPDGSKIAFEKSGQIYTMNANGSGATNIGSGDLDNSPSWSVNPPISVPKQATLDISTVDLSGRSVTGLWTVIRAVSDGAIVKSGFTPLLFTGNGGTSYKITVANYDGKVFSKWQDDNSTSKTRTITLTSNTTLTAIYDIGDALRGFTSLTYSGTSEEPDLTVNAKTSDDNTPLHMWMTIDPQSSNSTGTTYKVYATNGYQNLIFDHWSDNRSTDRIRTITVDKATTIIAYYKIQ